MCSLSPQLFCNHRHPLGTSRCAFSYTLHRHLTHLCNTLYIFLCRRHMGPYTFNEYTLNGVYTGRPSIIVRGVIATVLVNELSRPTPQGFLVRILTPYVFSPAPLRPFAAWHLAPYTSPSWPPFPVPNFSEFFPTSGLPRRRHRCIGTGERGARWACTVDPERPVSI